jgi:ligand-binding sensor domain-containing protein
MKDSRFLVKLCAIFSSYIYGQTVEGNLFVERFEEFNTSVEAIHKDKHGFLWVGGWDGFFRYDGISFKSYNNIIPTCTNFLVSDIKEDSTGNLWLGTALYDYIIYNPLNDSAYKVKYKTIERSFLLLY